MHFMCACVCVCVHVFNSFDPFSSDFLSICGISSENQNIIRKQEVIDIKASQQTLTHVAKIILPSISITTTNNKGGRASPCLKP